MATGDDINPLEIRLTTNQIALYLRDDLDYLATTLMPDTAIYPFPDFYRIAWALILQNLHTLTTSEIFRFALGLPRANCKTSFLKLLVCYLLIHDYEFDFILIVCATEPLAENFLEDVNSMMTTYVLTQVYGSWEQGKSRDTKKIKRITWQGRNLILAAIGAQTSLRGLNIGNKRPQLIICDDVQTKENDESPAERSALLRWLTGTLFKARAKVEKSAIFYIGNMYSTDCILYKFSKIPNWKSLITGSILADGTVLWPALNTLEELLEEYAHDAALGEGATWFAEVQNDPIGASIGLLDMGETVPLFTSPKPEDFDIYPTRFITIDPAGRKTTSDDNVIATHCLMDEEKIGTLHIDNGKYSPDQVIKLAITQAIRYKAGTIFVESIAYQSTLAFWMEKALAKLDLDIKVIPLPTGVASKYQRIKAWTKQFVHDKWYFARQEDYNKATFQLYAFRVDRVDNTDDILDVLAQAVIALNKHYPEIIQAIPLGPSELGKEIDIPVYRNNSYLDHFRNH